MKPCLSFEVAVATTVPSALVSTSLSKRHTPTKGLTVAHCPSRSRGAPLTIEEPHAHIVANTMIPVRMLGSSYDASFKGADCDSIRGAQPPKRRRNTL